MEKDLYEKLEIELDSAIAENERLATALKQAKDEVKVLKRQIDQIEVLAKELEEKNTRLETKLQYEQSRGDS